MENSTTFTRNLRAKIGTLAMALAIVIAAVTVQPVRVEAHKRHWRVQAQPHHRHWRRYHRGVIYAPAPDVYYAPPPVVYVPPPPPGDLSFIFPFRIR